MNWRRFDTEAFLKASKDWDEDLRKLREKLDNMPELPSVNNESGVRSSDISDMTYQMALRRLKIQSEIEELLLNKEMLRYSLRLLTEDERALVNGFYFPKKKIGVFVQEYGQSHGMSDRKVYYERNRVLKKIGLAIESEYYEDE